MERKRSQSFCGAGVDSIFINEKGDIYPCQLFDENASFFMGNIMIQDFNEKYKNNYQVTIAKLKQANKSNSEKCKDCICSFWCSFCIGTDSDDLMQDTSIPLEKCAYNEELTIATLNYFSELIQANKLELLAEGMKKLGYA